MRTLAIRQPWCTFIAEGQKTIEVRTWSTKYRGPLLIVASGKPLQLADDSGQLVTLPTQVQVCTVDLLDCRPLTPADFASACLQEWEPGDEDGYFAWVISNPNHVRPIPHKGKLNIYRTPEGCDHLPDGLHYLDFLP